MPLKPFHQSHHNRFTATKQFTDREVPRKIFREALWCDKNLKSGKASQGADAWVRRMVEECPGVLFGLLGRNRIEWEALDADWKAVLIQHLLGGLSDDDADDFLRKEPIPEEAIRRAIIHPAKGH